MLSMQITPVDPDLLNDVNLLRGIIQDKNKEIIQLQQEIIGLKKDEQYGDINQRDTRYNRRSKASQIKTEMDKTSMV